MILITLSLWFANNGHVTVKGNGVAKGENYGAYVYSSRGTIEFYRADSEKEI